MADRKHRRALVGLAVLALVVPAQAQSLDEVEKELTKAADKVKSFTAEVTMKSQMQQPGVTMESSGKGTIEFMRKGDETLWRMDQETSTVTEAAGQMQKTEVSTLTIVDGEFMYVLTERAGEKKAIKSKADPAQMKLAAKDVFDQLRKDHELKLLPEAPVEGVDAYVIEATPKKQVGPIAKQVLHFGKESGMLLKMEALDASGKPMHTTTFSALKLNVKIDPERFKFKAPEGVQVMDMTGAGTPKP